MRIGAYIVVASAAAFSAALWLVAPAGPEVHARVPIRGNDPAFIPQAPEEVPNPGTLVGGEGVPSDEEGSWPGFRGPLRDAKAPDVRIASRWPSAGPRVLWKIPALGEGHAGAAVHRGRVYLID